MPIYEYRCQACGTRFTQFFRTMGAAERAQVACPSCGAREVRRLISRVAVVSEGAVSSAEEEAASESEKPVVFGRKELQEIMRQREQWAQEVEAETSK